MTEQVPQSTDDITAEWLTRVLREGGGLAVGRTVTRVRPEALAEGVGFMGEVVRLHLDHDDPELPASLIAKIPTQDPTVREMLAPARVFEREAGFYRDLAPELAGTAPRAFHVGMDLEADRFLLIIEDFAGFRMGDQQTGCSVDDAAVALEALARLHARYWGGERLAHLDWIPPINSDGNKVGREIYAASLPGFTEAFGAVIDPANEDLVARFGANVPQLLDRLAAMPSTLVHFDYRLDNLFFGDNAEIRMIDFQTSAVGGGVYDVGYFLSQNVPVDDRRAAEDELLATYHAALVAGGVDGYDLDAVRADYRVGVLYGWVIPVFAVGTLDFTSERAVALWTEVVRRSQAAMLDHAVADLLVA